MREIARRYLGAIQKNLATYGKSLEYTEAALKTLSEMGFSLKSGPDSSSDGSMSGSRFPSPSTGKRGFQFRVETLEGELSVSWNS